MRTPAGKECRYFYGDYFRGRQQEECRLLAASNPPLVWRREFCITCPVPGILMANACSHMDIIPSLGRPFPFIKQQVQVRTFCRHTNRTGFDPHIGCGECHRLPEIFSKLDDDHPSV